MEANPAVGADQLTQLFFWGGHGGIGGGDDRQLTCSTITFRFLIEEMERRNLGLSFNKNTLPDEPDVSGPHLNLSESGLIGFASNLFGKYIRDVGSADNLHPSAVKRYQIVGDYRPDALKPYSDQVLSRQI